MKKILFGIFAVVGLFASDAYARCEYDLYTWVESGQYYSPLGTAVPVQHNVCKSEGGQGVKSCYIKCQGTTFKFGGAVHCEDGYNLVKGECVKPEPEASASGAGEKGTATAVSEKSKSGSGTSKEEKCSCSTQVAGGACAEAGMVNKKCVPTKCPKTVTEKGKTYNTYMVRNGKGGAVQYFCHNDALCELGNAKKKLSSFPQYALNTWQEGNVWYTDKKCKCADSTRVLKNGNCVCGGDTPIDNNGTCISQAHKDCIDTNGTWTGSACDCGSKVLNGTKCEEKSEPPVSQPVKQPVAPVEEDKQEPQPTEFLISGNIVGQDGEPLVATVMFGNWGVTAGVDGKFSTTYKGNSDDMLEISHVGCTSQKFKPADLKNKTIKLTCETSLEGMAFEGCKGDVDNGND